MRFIETVSPARNLLRFVYKNSIRGKEHLSKKFGNLKLVAFFALIRSGSCQKSEKNDASSVIVQSIHKRHIAGLT